ncbi:hypothetical protein ACFLRO_01020 [Bacteroidota bacterium]
MTATRKQFKGILEFLGDECIHGYMHFRFWRSVNNAFMEMPDTRRRYSLFFKVTWAAHDDAALLYLTRLYDRNHDSVTIHRMLKVANSNVDLFKHAMPGQVTAEVESDTKLFEKTLDPILKRLKAHRDTHVSHNDRSLLDPEAPFPADRKLDRRQAESLYRITIETINKYSLLLDDSETIMDNVIGEERVELLFKDLRNLSRD